MQSRKQGTTLFSALLFLIGVCVVVQLWLLAASVDALLGRNHRILIPAAIGSFVLGAINAGLVLFVFSFDHRLRQEEQED